jgi:hypothetical protein
MVPAASTLLFGIFANSRFLSLIQSLLFIDILLPAKLAFRKLNIPLHCVSYTPRRTLPEKIVALLKEWKSTSLFANYQYEVDELRRDLKVVELGKAAGIRFNLFTDKCVVEPGQVKTKEERPYSVIISLLPPFGIMLTINNQIYSPWLKSELWNTKALSGSPH